jgi:hypothetical protein
MDARREAQFVVKTTGKARNDADVSLQAQPFGAIGNCGTKS